MYLASTSELIERLAFLLKPNFNPQEPICRRCKLKLKQHISYEEEEIKIVWICKKCGCAVTESDGGQ